MANFEDLTGKVIGTIKFLERGPNLYGKTAWYCECTMCGAKKLLSANAVKKGSVKSCGCGCIKLLQTKECEICGKEFQTNSGVRKYCYDCSPFYKHGETNPSDIRKAMKTRAIEIKGGKCEKCGYDKCLGALHFHHKNPEQKSFSLSDNVFHSWSEWLLELEKCELLCANCHAEAHYNEEVKK